VATKRFQVLSEGLRLNAVVDMPDAGNTWPLVILNHAAARPKDGAFFDSLVPMLLERGIAVCRYDPRGYGQSEGAAASMSFWTRWLDLTAVTLYTADELEFTFTKLGLAGQGLGAVLGLWWAAVHPITAVAGFGLPPAKKLGSLPRAVQNLLPHDLEENAVIPHPAGIANGVLFFGEKEKAAESAQTVGERLGLQIEIIAGADKNFTQVKPRNDAFAKTADWFGRFLLAQSPSHQLEEEFGAMEAPPNEGESLTKEPAQE
jgi:pimeloyl-ACP methyl ester carboxylesterase